MDGLTLSRSQSRSLAFAVIHKRLRENDPAMCRREARKLARVMSKEASRAMGRMAVPAIEENDGR